MSTQTVFLQPTDPILTVSSTFIERSHVKLYMRTAAQREQGVEFIDASLLTEGIGYTWDNDGVIRPIPAPDGTRDYLIQRLTPVGPLVTQQPGVFSSDKVNLSVQQALNLGEEARDLIGRLDQRSFKAPQGEVGNLNLPGVAGRAERVLAFDPSGAPILDINATLLRQLIALSTTPGLTQLATNILYLAEGLGAGPRSASAKLQETVSVKDWGLSSAHAMAAIAYLQDRGGGNLFVPSGLYLWADVEIPDGPAVNIFGEGNHTLIRSPSATADVLIVNAWNSTISHVRFDAQVTRTGGCYVQLGGAHTRLESSSMEGDFIGVKMIGVGAKILANRFSNGAPGARRIWATGGDTSQTIALNLMDAQAPGVAAGIFADNSGALKVLFNDIIGQGRCLHCAPTTGQGIFSLKSAGNFYDNAVIGVAVECSGLGQFYRGESIGDASSSMLNSGYLFSAAGSAVVDGFDIYSTKSHLNGANGVTTTGAGVRNVRVNGGAIQANTGAAISIGAGVNETLVLDVQCQPGDGLGPNGNALFINGGAGTFDVQRCNLSGQTGPSVVGFTPGVANQTIRNCKGFVTNTRGHATVVAGTGSITVAHGLAGTPTRILINPLADPAGRAWAEFASRTPTQFSINQGNDAVGYNVRYDWEAFYE